MKLKIDLLDDEDSPSSRLVAALEFDTTDVVLVIGSLAYEDVKVEDFAAMMKNCRAIMWEAEIDGILGLAAMEEMFLEDDREDLARCLHEVAVR